MKKDSSVISVRVDSDIKKILELESEINNVTLNTLISQVISKYAEWGKFTEDIGIVTVFQQFLREILNKISDDELIDLAKKFCVPAFDDAINFIHGEITKQSILTTLFSWLSSSNIPYRKISTQNGYKIIIQHGLGKKWSLYFSTLINEMFSKFESTVESMSLTEHNISFQVSLDK